MQSAQDDSCKLEPKNGVVDDGGCFDWPKYLTKRHAIAAPPCSFFQPEKSPPNTFEVGMLLAARDSRCQTSLCIAKVTKVAGCRICLLLLGTDGLNPFWRLVDDSSNIYPLSYADDTLPFKKLQPPMAFTKEISSWQRYKKKYLLEGPHAPESCFYKEPKKPEKNYFKVGMKLEAVDLKDTNEFVYPATVCAVSGTEVTLNFDGYDSIVNQNYRYDSRLLFPVGFNEKKLVLIPPSCYVYATPPASDLSTKLKPKVKTIFHKPPKMPITSNVDISTDELPIAQRKRPLVSQIKKKPRSPARSASNGSSTGTVSMSQTPSTTALDGQTPKKFAKKSFIKSDSSSAASNIAPDAAVSSSSSSMGSAPSASCSNNSFASTSSTSAAGLSRPDVVLSTKSEKMSVFLNCACNPGPLLDSAKICSLPKQFGPGSPALVLQEFFQSAIKACGSQMQRQVFQLIPVSDVQQTAQIAVIVDMEDGKSFIRTLPLTSSSQKAFELIETFARQLKCCPNFISRTLNNTCACGYSKPLFPELTSRDISSPSYAATYSPISENSHSPSSITDNSTSYLNRSPTSWTVDDVSEWLSQQDNVEVRFLRDAFREKKIDGKALLELNGELCVKYFNVKIGTAFHMQYLIGTLAQLVQSFAKG